MNYCKKYFIVKTDINIKGEVSVSYLSSQNNVWGTYWSSEYRNKHMNYYDSEEKALSVAKCFGTEVSVHWMYID